MKVRVSAPRPVFRTAKNKAGDYINTGEAIEGLSVVWIEAEAEASSLENVGRVAKAAQPEYEVRRIQGPYFKDTGTVAYKVTLGEPEPELDVPVW